MLQNKVKSWESQRTGMSHRTCVTQHKAQVANESVQLGGRKRAGREVSQRGKSRWAEACANMHVRRGLKNTPHIHRVVHAADTHAEIR